MARKWGDGYWGEGTWGSEVRTILFTRRDFVAESVAKFSGGAWLTPFDILLDPRPQTVIQALSPDPRDTWFQLDLGAQRSIGLFHFQGFRVTSLATMRIYAGNDANFVSNVYDSGVITCWPQDKTPGQRNALGELSFTGVYDADEYVPMGMPRFIIPPSSMNARFIRVEIFDPTAAQPAQIGVFGACETWTSLRSPDFGHSIAVLDMADSQTAPYGSRFIVSRGKRRKISLGYTATLTESEVMAQIHGWLLMVGKSRPFVVSIFPDDKPNVERRAIWGTLSNDPEIVNPYFGQYSIGLQIEQLV